MQRATLRAVQEPAVCAYPTYEWDAVHHILSFDLRVDLKVLPGSSPVEEIIAAFAKRVNKLVQP